MAEAGNTWQETKPNVEHFLQGKYLQSDGWDRPGRYSYEYIPDSKVFGSEIKDDFPRCQFHVKSLIHATTPKAAVEIITKGGLRPNLKWLGEKGLHLIWWGIALEEADINEYTEQCRIFTDKIKRAREANDNICDRLRALTPEDWMKNFCSSAPFARESRYGNIAFEYPADELFLAYSSQFCGGEHPIFRVMGTFAYRQEVMHALLVCPPENVNAEFPLMNDEAGVVFKQNGVWVWHPQTTGDSIYGSKTPDKYRRWEHLTFAFLVQEGQIFKLANNDTHISYCLAANAAVFRKHTNRQDRKRWTLDEILGILHKKTIFKPILLSMIQKHILQVLRLPFRDGNTECCHKDFKISLRFLQTLHDDEPGQNRQSTYCPHELREKVGNPAICKQQWVLWIREITQNLPME